MRIAFDARPLIGPRTGVGVWLEGLLRALAATTDWTFSLLLPRRSVLAGLDDLAHRLRVLPSPVPLPGTVWLHALAAPQAEAAGEVFVGTLGVLPRRLARPAVLMIHDLTPVTRPHHHTVTNRFCFSAYAAESVTAADAVVCLSEATRVRLQRWLPGRASRAAAVIGPGVDPFFSPPPDGEGPAPTRQRFAAGRPFVVQLGTLEPRKGVATLVEAHARLLRAGAAVPDLVLAGGEGWRPAGVAAALERHPQLGRVHRPGYVTRDEARALLRHAEVVVVASEEEGFGLPVAEAMACGAACVISDDPALMEAAGGAAAVFPRRDAGELQRCLGTVLAGDVRAELQARSRARAPELGWHKPVGRWHRLLRHLTMPGNAATGD